MPARTGEEYIAGLRERSADIYINGERVEDVTTHPALCNGVRTLANLYDMQHDPALRDEMTYTSPTTGDRVGLSFITPRTIRELEQRRVMMTHWARATCGMIGRTPDFLNVTVMSMAAASDYFAQNRSEFKDNVHQYYEYVRENDLALTHTLGNVQRTRSPSAASGPQDDRSDIALKVVRETDAGIVVRGARSMATLGSLSDEVMVYLAGSLKVPAHDAERYTFAFSIPCNTPGLKFLCRESLDYGRSHFDHPLGSRFEEEDSILFFDNVLVPWERVFLLGDLDLSNNMVMDTNQYNHSRHQSVAKNVVKCEFILGLANLMVHTLGSGQLPHVQQMMAEIIENLEVTKACLRSAESDAGIDRWGVMCPSTTPLMIACKVFIRMYPRMTEILHLLGSSSLMALPTEADLNGPLASEIERYLETDTASAEERVRVFRLAWDTCCSAFGSRQTLYERFFQGDDLLNSGRLYSLYDRAPMTNWVKEFLEQE